MNASFDPRAGRLAASEQQLQDLASLHEGAGLDADTEAILVAAGFLRPDGSLVDELVPVARTVAAPVADLALRRAHRLGATRVRVRWSPHATVAASPHGDTTTVDQVLVGAPTALARILWQLAELGPRPRPDAAVVEATDDALAPFRDGVAGTWADRVGATDARLLRLEGEVEDQQLAIVVADLDGGGLWRPDGPVDDVGRRWRPVSPVDVFGAVADVQTALVAAA